VLMPDSRFHRLVFIGCLCGVIGALVWRYSSRQAGGDRQRSIERPSVDELSVEQLRRVARDLGIPGRSKMRKQQLIEAINQRDDAGRRS
jgi:Rho termination factor, N-terminal domain